MDFYLKSDIGQTRHQNEDAVYAEDVRVGGLENLFVVCDGMGGYKAGDYASKKTIEVLLRDLRETGEEEPVPALRNALSRANQLINIEAAEADKKGMGTTVVCATIRDDIMTVANVGDSRLYLINGDSMRKVTYDHFYVSEMVRTGRMNKHAAARHPKKHAITRAIGAEDTVKIDFFEERIEAGDQVLLCSDGLTNMVSNEDILRILKESDNVKNAVEALVSLANQNGGADNISVIVVTI